MEKYSVIILITILQSSIFIASEQPEYIPRDNITLNCGAPIDLLANAGRSWAPEFPVPNSNTLSLLLQARNSFVSTSIRCPMNNMVDPRPFSLSKLIQRGRYWFSREICLNMKDNEVLDLVFTPSSSASNDTYAFNNGIENVSMPTNLYYTLPDSTYVPFVGQNYPFLVKNDTIIEMAYRLNVGAKPISHKDDTGLFRNSSNDYFYMTKNNYVTVNTSMLINYTMIPRYTAPEMVYQTTQAMGPSLAYNEKHNLSWRLPMGSGFRYMVRLHFCEPQDLVNSLGDQKFKVFINSQTAKQNADVIVWTVQGKVSIFKDYVVLVSKEYITIHAKYYDVILNGIQVFKLSNSNGNLGKPNLELQVHNHLRIRPILQVKNPRREAC
ncbi:receptor-like protein kinase FERONIA [Gossypium hirsutum]|uniref:Receptor-like protein kinase FERONIA n=1 Tax=Gossypium hirsutum TaxID=3635 RepID=A0A1U8P8D3_GOSHI|nr:receptor-like protein kinase FERONIA [Gossypium hirsutum]